MEGSRGLSPIYDQLQVTFSEAHQEMGFVQFEEHNQVVSFLTPPSSSLPSPINGGGGRKIAAATDNGSLRFNHTDQLANRPSWNNDQVVGFLYSFRFGNLGYTFRFSIAVIIIRLFVASSPRSFVIYELKEKWFLSEILLNGENLYYR